MTKPSYEEPDYFALCAEHGALREKNSLPYATCVRCLLASSEQKRYAAEAENLRVRGLLQRIAEMVRDMPELNPANYDHDQVCDLNARVCELDKLHSGAA